MAKECNVCGYSPETPAKPAGKPEDCPKCHSAGSVVEIEEDEDEE